MSNNIQKLLLLPALIMTLVFVGCKSDSTYEADTSSSCVMSVVTMGTLNRAIHVKTEDGRDSTYVSRVTGALYPMAIDQIGCRIFNSDSLPENTDASKVVFAALNSTGSITIRSLSTAQDTAITTTDTIDCSVPRLLTVHATDGVSKRTYTLEVRVHREAADSVVWQRLGCHSDIAAATKQKAIVKDNTLYVFARRNGQVIVLTAPTDNPTVLTRNDIDLANMDVRTVICQGDKFYALAQGKPICSTDGITWKEVEGTAPASFSSLPVAGTDRLIATTSDGAIYSSRDGAQTWQSDETELAKPLPKGQVQGLCIPTAADPTYEDLLLFGENDDSPTIWKRNIDLTGAVSYPWTYYPGTISEEYACPLLKSQVLANYDGGTLLLGLKDGTLATPRLSRDNGRTWDSKLIKRPDADASGSLSAAVTADNYIILYCGGSGEIWRGRINRLGWKLGS